VGWEAVVNAGRLIANVMKEWSSFGTKALSLTVSEIFNGKCDAIDDMTLNDL